MLISIAFTNLKNNWIIQLAQGFLTFSDWWHPSLLIEHIGGTPIYNLLVSRPQVQKMPALRFRTTELANQMIWNCVKYCDVMWHILTYCDTLLRHVNFFYLLAVVCSQVPYPDGPVNRTDEKRDFFKCEFWQILTKRVLKCPLKEAWKRVGQLWKG